MKLATLIANLTPVLDVPATELTEAQRAVKEQFYCDSGYEALGDEVFKGKAGPGGGVDTTPFVASFFLLAFTHRTPRRETVSTTWRTWHLYRDGCVLAGWGDDFRPTIVRCGLTGEFMFGEALRKIISDEDLAARVDEVRVAPGVRSSIHYDGGKVSTFGDDSKNPRNFYVEIVLRGSVFHATSQWIKRDI